ncbi:3'(2'),5'-bisphosphate nucleotidase CysQ [Asticcacaulis sp. EMRT-3]|uniref:3'(2'),5'-bisphosphate nucleotidase CysQ n=1 Tax=Asticcacaulis sp. EMRT-3 TaxID=3040349 RepID=UPI0024AFD6B0|nr:3'(2'),5'-bisphosphate nucleotidase CysQ [Asticcacaulis sp. EMRT-3]MDI7776369.1 3'(2'),5'-bisphosphate nucleotidase CysQ [Asticcacaulis sp. EMRT-3]
MDLKPIMLAAGAEIMRIYATDFKVVSKEDASPVTEADKSAEAIILAGLHHIAPGIPVVAEEEAAAGRFPSLAGTFFLVDPLDGTKEFISKNGEFTVNIALIEDGVPVMGAVFAPAIGRMWWGSKTGGAFVAEVAGGVIGEARPVHVRKPAGALTAIGSRSHGSEATQKYLEAYDVAEFVAAGSSLKFCLLAEGRADIYPRMGRTMEWDTAAGDAVLRAAGGRVETLDGQPLLYGKRFDSGDGAYANPHFVAFGDAEIGA